MTKNTPAPIPNGFTAPFSQEAEQATIGSVLINPALFDQMAFLRAEDFFLLRHQYIWESITTLARSGSPIDLLLILNQLNAKAPNRADEVGGYAYLIETANGMPSSMNGLAYAHLVKRLSARRGMLLVSEEIKRLAYAEDTTVDYMFSESIRMIEDVNMVQAQGDIITLQDAMKDHLSTIKQRVALHVANPNYVMGVATDFHELDHITSGFRPGAITTLAGATGMGKTATVMTMALNASLNGIQRDVTKPANVLMFCGEMTQSQMNDRFLAMKTGIPTRNLERGSLTQEDGQKISLAMRELGQHRLKFESLKRLTPLQIRNRVRRMMSAQDLDLFILDGLLQIDALREEPNTTKRQKVYMDGKRRDVLEMVLNDLEDITTSYQVPILLTHQISRAANNRQDKRPKLSDLAEAVFVEQKSSLVLLLYRDEYYNSETPAPNVMEIHIAKNRFGETGAVEMYFEKSRTQVLNMTKNQVDLSNL